MAFLFPYLKSAKSCQAAVRRVLTVEGQVSAQEAEALWKLAFEVQPGLDIVEIGSYQGRSTLALAYGAAAGSKNRVYAVDPHDEYVGPKGGIYGPKDLANLYRNIVIHNLGELVSVVSLSGVDGARSWGRASIGLLWIDGDHRYEAVKQDLDGWWPHLADSAVIAFHDTCDEGVSQVINEAISSGNLVFEGETGVTKWFRRAQINE